MAKKSSNTQGNPYHDEETGEFTSPGSSSSTPTPIEAPQGLKLKIKQGVNVAGIISELNQVSNIKRLTTSDEIEENITQFFSKTVVEKIDSLYGKTAGCASFQFRPKANPNIILEIFPNVLGKYRYKDNHAHIITSEQYKTMVYSGKYNRIYRGISSSGERARNIINNYGTIDLDSFDYYCPNGGNCYGSNIYTTVNMSYARSYSGYQGTLIEGVLDEKNSWSMPYDSVRKICNNLNEQNISDKVSKHLESVGLESDRANRIGKSFARAVKNDAGLVAILMGLDYYIADGHQRNLFNLNKWYIKEV